MCRLTVSVSPASTAVAVPDPEMFAIIAMSTGTGDSLALKFLPDCPCGDATAAMTSTAANAFRTVTLLSMAVKCAVLRLRSHRYSGELRRNDMRKG